ncbi:MAG TPA: hypothetical protein VGI87_03360 [Solirubrobacteraceae bacterium]
MTPTLRAMAVPDPAERWEALAFEVVSGAVLLPHVRVVLAAPRLSVTIEGVAQLPDGLALAPAEPAWAAHSDHPNGAMGIDHVVAVTPEFDATVAALEGVGLPLKRIRDAGSFRQGFRRLGEPILEVVEARQAPAPAWWGLTVTVADLNALPEDLISSPKPAVQPGRFIATARSPGTPLAFITPDPESPLGPAHARPLS